MVTSINNSLVSENESNVTPQSLDSITTVLYGRKEGHDFETFCVPTVAWRHKRPCRELQTTKIVVKLQFLSI